MNITKRLLGATRVAVATLFATMAALTWGGGGVSGTGNESDGMITDFGSVFVNGIEYFTNGTNIIINGDAQRAESELRIGMVTHVVGTVNANKTSGQATTITYHADLIGTVDAPPVHSGNASAFSVYGLSVTTAADTIFDDLLRASDLAAGDTVEVSGLYNSQDNSILAKRVERKTAAASLQLSGVVRGVTSAGFTLGTLTVNTAALSNFNADALTAGQRVRVKAPSQTATGAITASSVEILSNTDSRDGVYMDLQGVVAHARNGTFRLGKTTVNTNATTIYLNGAAGNLFNGAEVEVAGRLSGGVFTATRVSFAKSEPVRLIGHVTSRVGDTLTIFGEGGVRVRVTNATSMNDTSGAARNNFNAADLRVGDRIDVRGNPDENQVVILDRLERTAPNQFIEIQGRVSGAAGPRISIANQVVNTTANSKFSDAKGLSLSADAFSAGVAGHTVWLRGVLNNGVIEASSADIKP